MPFEDRIKGFWHVMRADTPGGAQARRRAAALGAIALFLLVLLAAVGLFRYVLFGVAAAACGACLAAAVLLVVRHAPRGARLAARVPDSGRRIAHASAGGAARARTHVSPALRGAARWSSRARSVAGLQLATATAGAQRNVRAATARVGAQATAAWPTRTPGVRHREALRANAVGLRLRRDGAYLEAAEEHRVALALFRDLGDRRSEALTLNNLALALDRAGDGAALDLFEQAATMLGDLGEEQHEGEVIANLALAFRRRGSDERSAEVFELALGKLEPDSQAYRKVENLRRAS